MNEWLLTSRRCDDTGRVSIPDAPTGGYDGLVLLGTFVVGLLEMLFGAGHSVPAGEQIEHQPLVPIEIRAYVIMAGLLIWGLYAVYRLVATTPARAEAA